jgi:type II secretory pathway pseudopilin PulG
MKLSHRRGFTLVELMVTASTMTVLGSLGMMALQSATSSANVARAKADASTEARAVATALGSELQLALTRDGGEAVAIAENPYPGCALEIAFAIPGAGPNESRAVRYRYLTEDLDGDGILDPNEDSILADSALTGRIERIEDVKGEDGAPVAVVTIVGGAHSVSALELTLRGNLLKVLATSSKPIAGTRRILGDDEGLTSEYASATSVARVYLMN